MTHPNPPQHGPHLTPDVLHAVMRTARATFPAVTQGDTVFLDNASGAQLPERVLDAMDHAMRTMQVNKGGAYPASQRVTEAKQRVRERTASFLGIPGDADGIAFGANATTLLFLLAEAVIDTLHEGDEIIVTGLDHHANRDPWRRLTRRGIEVRTWAPRGKEQTLHPDDLASLLNDRTRIVAMTAASNLLGTHGPVAQVGARLANHPARLVVDAVHFAPHALPDVAAWRADAVAFSPYKVFAPHLGALWIRDDWRAALPDWGLSFLPAGPLRWEPGTQNHEAIVAFGAALDHLTWLGVQLGADHASAERDQWQVAYTAIDMHERALLERLMTGLDALGATRYGPGGLEGRTATVGFTLENHAPIDVARHLGKAGIAVTAGHAYAERLVVDHLDLPSGVVRASLLHYSDASDVDALLTQLASLVT